MLLIRKVRHSSSISVFSARFFSSICGTLPKGNEIPWIPIRVTKLGQYFRFQPYSITPAEFPILVQAPNLDLLILEIVKSLDQLRLNDAWVLFEKHLHLDGIPPKPVLIQLIASSAESLNVDYLIKSERLVQKIVEDGKGELLEKEPLVYLSFCLAKRQLPVESATILRILVKLELYPTVAAWSAIVSHLCKSPAGALLSAEIVSEIGGLFQDGKIDPRKKVNSPLFAMKPDANTFTIALTGCLNFRLFRKAENLLQFLPLLHVKLTDPLMIAMSHVYERNGRKEELKKLARYVDESPALTDSQLRQFQNCLLSCHMKLGDLSFASEMVLKMLRLSKKAKNTLSSLPSSFSCSPSNSSTSSQTPELKTETKHIEYKEFLHEKYLQPEASVVQAIEGELLVTKRGILQPTEQLYAKLTKAYLESGKVKELGRFLIKAEREDTPYSNDRSLIIRVINTCISTNKLDEAHDLLDEMRLTGTKVSSSVYSALLKSYCRNKRVSEARALLRDSRRANVQLDRESYELVMKSRIADNDNEGAALLYQEMKQEKVGKREDAGSVAEEADELTRRLVEEIRRGSGGEAAVGVNYWNNVVHFFARRGMMRDAERALERMRGMGHVANGETYHAMVTGYAAAGGSYNEVAELWGEVKRAEVRVDQEVLDAVLYVFVRGGFFGRANEVIEMIHKGGMFVDRYKYRMLFLKYHKTLCRGKPSKNQTHPNAMRRDAVIRFRKWVALD